MTVPRELLESGGKQQQQPHLHLLLLQDHGAGELSFAGKASKASKSGSTLSKACSAIVRELQPAAVSTTRFEPRFKN